MILALRALGLGDLLTVVPALRALKRARPEETLVLASPSPLRPLVTMGGLADRFLAVESAVTEPPRPFPPPDEPVTVAVNLHGGGPQSTEVLRRLRPAVLWSYGVPGAPAWNADEHEVVRWCRLVEHYGSPADPADIGLRPRTGRGIGVVVHPGAAAPDRRWPAERFATVAADLADRGHPVRITAGPGEEALAGGVVRAAARPTVTLGAGLDLAALTEVVGESALVVCGDTGVAHLATALGTPSVVIFGPQPPSRWGPPPLPRHRVLWHPPSVTAVQVAEVLAEAAAALSVAES